MDDDVYGPPLPPGFKLPVNEDSGSDNEQPKKKAKKMFGPQIPAFLASKLAEGSCDDVPEISESQSSKIIGPILPGMHQESSDTDDDNEVYGPMPSRTKMDYDVVGMIEKRAANMKNKLTNMDAPKVESTQREEWMVVPDTSRRNQLGAISRCLAPGSKVQKKETDYYNPEDDEKTTKELKKYNKSKRGESLLDMHREKKKKDKKQKKPEKKERKAFDREEIGGRLFSKEQVNSVIDKSKYLNSRFAPGKSQFL